MSMQKFRAILDLSVDLDHVESPENWNWVQLLDLGPHEDLTNVRVNDHKVFIAVCDCKNNGINVQACDSKPGAVDFILSQWVSDEDLSRCQLTRDEARALLMEDEYLALEAREDYYSIHESDVIATGKAG